MQNVPPAEHDGAFRFRREPSRVWQGEKLSQFIKGSLVRWPSGPKSPLGVITEVDGGRLTVNFDGDESPKIFRSDAAVLQAVELSGLVIRVSSGAIGFVQSRASTNPPRWQVIIDQTLLTVPEADLRPHILDDPMSRMRDLRLGTPKQFALAATARRYIIDQFSNELVSLGQSRVDIKPHQISVVHRVITSYPHRYLLCDEVGLGKTIEAGMILKELRARNNAARVIVVVPPNLMRQWQYEMKTKFNETFSIINSDTIKYLKTTQKFEGNPFDAFDSVIVSNRWITGKKWAALAAEASWDLVIVDEAHHARVTRSGSTRTETRLFKTVKSLVSPDSFSKRAALLLTATPMQLDTSELYSLVELLDPALFPTEEHFNRHRSSLPGLSRLVHELTEHGFPLPDSDDDEVIEKVSDWLEIKPIDAEARLVSGTVSIEALCAELSSKHLLSEVLIRNRKKIVGGFMPRQATRWEVALTEQEQLALNAVENYVREGYARAERSSDAASGFVMVIYQKMMASSIQAIKVSLNRRTEKLEHGALSPVLTKAMKKDLDGFEESLDNDEFISNLLAEVGEAHKEEAADLTRLVDLLAALPTDSKAETLIAQLKGLETHEPNVKVLLFTQFRETQEYLKTQLESLGWEVFLFHGQLKPDAKDTAVESFRASQRPCILLSTEAGGEGRNFQFCHILVNYDLPWNPMRIEQRIGRIDRIGQDHVVQVFNFWVKGTVEERVLDVLENRIHIFEETVGGLDPILGSAETDITKIMRTAGAQRENALRTFGEKIEKEVLAARGAEEKLRDFIMETKSFSRGIAAAISGQPPTLAPDEEELFSTNLLADVKTYLRENPDGTFQIGFHEPFISDFPKHSKTPTKDLTVAFRRDINSDSEHIEYMGFGHPIINDLAERVMSTAYAGAASAFQVSNDLGIDSPGWLFVFEIEIPAVDAIHQISSYFVPDDENAADTDAGEVIIASCASFLKTKPAEVDEDALARLEVAHEIAQRGALDQLATLENEARSLAKRNLDREQNKLIKYFDYRDQVAIDKLESQRAIVSRLEASEDVKSRAILPVWRSNVTRSEQLIEDLKQEREERLSTLKMRAEGIGDLKCVAVARIAPEHSDLESGKSAPLANAEG